MKRPKLLTAILASVVTAALVIGPAALTSAHTSRTTDTNFRNIPVHGHVEGTGKRFKGTMDIRRFAQDGAGNLEAVARITGVMRNSSGEVIGRVDGARRRLPLTGLTTRSATTTSGATANAATCDVLHLELGPLDLNLLGLVVHLNKVVLDIDAQSGPGNLLGNLICAIAGILDGGLFSGLPPNLTTVLQNLLNAIIAILRL